ncbi:MAG: hypothetical protein HOP10_05375 [Chitinophagaceae bacterium]|nr:hypothetical protein [Chitinophagaceae bacterium]
MKQITIISNDETREIYMYDMKGNQTERWFFKPVEVLDHRYKAVYNEKGQLLEETKFNKGIAPVVKYIYAYNEKGLPIGRSLFSENNTLLEKHIYQYDTAERMTDSIQLDTYGNVIMKCNWQYDPGGRRIKTSLYWNDTLVHTKMFEYNKEGKMIRETKNPTFGNDPDLIIYSYDEKGNRTMVDKRFTDSRANNKELSDYDSSGNLISYTYLPQDEKNNVKIVRVFDDRKKVIGQTRYHAGIIYNRYSYKYDDKGNELEMDVYNESEKVPYHITWKYEFDRNGNWIRRTRFGNGVPDDNVKREIEYY